METDETDVIFAASFLAWQVLVFILFVQEK